MAAAAKLLPVDSTHSKRHTNSDGARHHGGASFSDLQEHTTSQTERSHETFVPLTLTTVILLLRVCSRVRIRSLLTVVSAMSALSSASSSSCWIFLKCTVVLLACSSCWTGRRRIRLTLHFLQSKNTASQFKMAATASVPSCCTRWSWSQMCFLPLTLSYYYTNCKTS